MDYVTIIQGDDTNFLDDQFLLVTFDTDIDLSGFTAIFSLEDVTLTYGNLSSKTFNIILSNDITSNLTIGKKYGEIKLIDTSNRIKTITSVIPFLIKKGVNEDIRISNSSLNVTMNVNNTVIDVVVETPGISKTEAQKILASCNEAVQQTQNNANSLLSLIENAKSTIDFAIYGFSGEDYILKALLKAQERGVIVRGIVDKDIRNINIYKDTPKLMSALKTIKTDYAEDKRMEQLEIERLKKYQNKYNLEKFDIRSAIMHDKFFIGDNTYLWTGSTNVTENCLSYNANNSVLIKSKEVANLYKQEFNQMYDKDKFHLSKDVISNNENIKLNDNTSVSVYFSPQNKPITTSVIPLIDKAQKSIYTPIFYLTHQGVIDSLINAKKRGVDVYVIIDANSASNEFSKHHQLRKNNIKVKAENWGGKMHMKSAIIDERYLIIASMNWTKSAENRNDENTIIIDNENLAKEFKKEFFYLWDNIPNKWLRKDPKAESPDSIGSCFDGVDNNHDGLVDLDDPNCQCYQNKKINTCSFR